MALVKICPSCGRVNTFDALMCSECMKDLSTVEITDTECEKISAKFLVLECMSSPGKITLKEDSILGREAECSEFLGKFGTVSRIHAKFACGETWTVEDLNSTNGTYLNGRRLTQGEKCPLKPGDTIALSKSCVFTVKYIDEVHL